MGQFALGLRSLAIKAAIFVIMAALLAWALGGTLWPKPVRATDFKDSVYHKGGVYWRLDVGGKERGEVRWSLMLNIPHRAVTLIDEGWDDVSGPVLAEGALYVAALSDPAEGGLGTWHIERIEMTSLTQLNRTKFPMPDRLAVEQQLERLKAGLPLQDVETIQRQRQTVLDPP